MEGRRGRRRKQLQNDLQDKEDPGPRKAKYQIVLCGELALEEAMDLTHDRLRND